MFDCLPNAVAAILDDDHMRFWYDMRPLTLREADRTALQSTLIY